MPIRFLALAFLILVSSSLASTKRCKSNPQKYQYLTGTIGTGDKENPTYLFMECDTMYVKEDDMVEIKQHTYLAFKNPNPYNVIIVKGNLIAMGKRGHKISISSNIDTLLFSKDSYLKAWQGIKVEETGSLNLTHVNFYGAMVPVQSVSKEVKIESSNFYGAKHIVTYKTRPLPMESKKKVSRFSLNNYITKLNSGNFTYETR